LINFENKTKAIKGKKNITDFLDDNVIPYIDNNDRKLIIYDKSYSSSSITLYSEEEVINIILTLKENKRAEDIRRSLLAEGYISPIAINNVSLSEKEQELSELVNELKADKAKLEKRLNEFENLIKDERAQMEEERKQRAEEKDLLEKTINGLQNTIDILKKSIDENNKQKEKKGFIRTIKKWWENKFGGDNEEEQVIEEEISKNNINEYPSPESNRIRPESNPETKNIGKFKPAEVSWMKLRKGINELVITVTEIENKDKQKYWIELHTMISNKFRNGANIPSSCKIHPYNKPSKINSYTTEELLFLTEYLKEIIEKSCVNND
jgi:hypothetical protein